MDAKAMQDGQITLDSEYGKELGFTSDLFFGYLWKTGDRITISFIESRHQGKGNLSALFSRIETKGFRVAVPTPLGHMEAILLKKGFSPVLENDDMMGAVEVWMREAEHD